MENRKNIKIGDYVRWLYPLGYVDINKRQFSYGLIINQREEGEDYIDGRIVLLLDSGYKQSFWLSLDLLIDLGSLEILKDGNWQKVE
jgi:hypothetical protein|tara:strand:+ start:1975 stop:2235 length:261 start_codon:yes stop_codon:yes gene_type:complete